MASKLEAVATGDLNDYANWAPCSSRGQVLLSIPKYKTGPML